MTLPDFKALRKRIDTLATDNAALAKYAASLEARLDVDLGAAEAIDDFIRDREAGISDGALEAGAAAIRRLASK